MGFYIMKFNFLCGEASNLASAVKTETGKYTRNFSYCQSHILDVPANRMYSKAEVRFFLNKEYSKLSNFINPNIRLYLCIIFVCGYMHIIGGVSQI